jgi:hypothetical protein
MRKSGNVGKAVIFRKQGKYIIEENVNLPRELVNYNFLSLCSYGINVTSQPSIKKLMQKT